MKIRYLLLILSSFLISQTISSQEIAGIATYKSFAKFDLKMDSTKVNREMQEQLTQMLRQQTQKEYELHFNKNEAVFKLKEKLDAPGNTLPPGTTITSSGGFGISYKNLKKNRATVQRDLLGKMFLIKDTLKKQDWKLEKETKNIGEYTCFKATRTRSSENSEAGENKEIQIVAWYTPQIPAAFGPENYGGLPGLILEVTDGEFSYLCSQIILNPKKGVDIEEPTKGKNVSMKEYIEIQDKKNEEMQNRYQSPNSKNIEIRIGG